MKRYIIRGAILAVFIFAIIATLAKINEREASKSFLVNISKRTAAELGDFFVNYIHDPGFDGEGYIYFGPKDTRPFLFNNQGKEKELIAFLKDKSNATIIRYVNNVPSRYAANFDYQPFDSKKLMTLRERYQLGKLTEGIKGEFERIMFLRDWVKNRWEHGAPQNVSYNFDALDILNRAEKGERFFCSEYSTTFVQCALSIGLQSRYVGLFKGHMVTEVWSNEFTKWVVIDVDNNLHYVKNKIPLNALELHDLWVRGKWDEVQMLVGPEKKAADEKKKKELLPFYHEFYVRMRNDWFSKRYPHWHPKANSIMNGLEWKDEYTSNNILVARETGNKEELYFPLNVTSLNIIKEQSSKDRIHLFLSTFTPNFSHYIIRVDNKKLIKQTNSTVVWNIHRGQNKIQIQSVNSLGVKGPSSEINFVIL
jgi:hypothetical protein